MKTRSKATHPAPADFSFLIALSLVLGYAAFNYGGTALAAWNQCLIGLAAASALFWLARGSHRRSSRRSEHASLWVAGLPLTLVAYTAIQMIPLPAGVVGQLSPARREIADALIPLGLGAASFPLTVSSVLTFPHLLRLVAYLLVYLALRELTARLRERLSWLVIPLLTVASVEALLGLIQTLSGADRATGTYANANHLAGMLEMSLPFAIALTVQAVAKRNWLNAVAPGTCSLLLFTALLFTSSRTGFAATLASLAILTGFYLMTEGRRGTKLLAALAIPATLLPILFVAVPNQLLDRLAETGGIDVRPDVRFGIWKETLHLIAAFPVFGCGLGTYVSAMQRYRVSSSPLALVDFAHNDYLQFLAEWGIAGFLPALVFVFLLFRRAWKGATLANPDHRWLCAACFAALSALAVHSLADFNLYIPVNAVIAAWIAGITVGATRDIQRAKTPSGG